MSSEHRGRELLGALSDYLLDHPDQQLERFKPALRDWGDRYQSVAATRLPVAEFIAAAAGACDGAEGDLLQTFARHDAYLHWEQSYRRQDKLVPEAMLDGYGFAEIIGSRGPFVSDRIRAGIAAWGPGIVYPSHHHQAEEAYILLYGSAEFHIADQPATLYRAGDVAYIAANRLHGFRTVDEPLVLAYLWQAGDLRQTSTFA